MISPSADFIPSVQNLPNFLIDCSATGSIILSVSFINTSNLKFESLKVIPMGAASTNPNYSLPGIPTPILFLYILRLTPLLYFQFHYQHNHMH